MVYSDLLKHIRTIDEVEQLSFEIETLTVEPEFVKVI